MKELSKVHSDEKIVSWKLSQLSEINTVHSDNEVILRTTIDSTLIIENSIREGVEVPVCSVL